MAPTAAAIHICSPTLHGSPRRSAKDALSLCQPARAVVGRGTRLFNDHCRGRDPVFTFALWLLGIHKADLGLFDEAIALLQQAAVLGERQPFFLGALGYAHGLSGNSPAARAVLEEILSREASQWVDPWSIAAIHIGLGGFDQAVDFIEKMIEERSIHRLWLAREPMYDPLRANPRFVQILKKLPLPS